MRVELKNHIFGNSKSKAGITIMAALVGFLLIGLLSGRSGEESMRVGAFKPLLLPNLNHPLGTDNFGRDYLSIMLASFGNSLFIGLLAGVISTTIATFVALVTGYKGGIWDEALGFLTSAMLIIPLWPILAVIVTYVRNVGLITMALILSIFSWPWASRTTKAQVLTLKEQAYVDLAKVSGLSDVEIIITEIMPNLAPYIAVGLSNSIVGAIFAEVGLGVVGLGPADAITLGRAVNDCITMGALSLGRWNLIIPPILFIMLTFLSLNLLIIGLDEVFNPRLKKITGM